MKSAVRAASSRTNSEDRAEVFEHEDCLIVVAADGAGGLAGGAAASDALVDAARARIAQRPFDPYDVRAWSDVLTTADAELVRRNGGETTAIVVVLGPHGVVGVSVGDSEAWVVSHHCDPLTERQDRARVGTGRCRPTPFHRPRPEGVVVVATDGLFKSARRDQIIASCTSADVAEIANRLLELPKLASGRYPDDVAVAVVALPKALRP